MNGLASLWYDSWNQLVQTCETLIRPAIFFLALAMLVKGKGAIADIRRAMPETGLNVQILVFNIFVTVPVIAILATFLYGFVQAHGLTLLSQAQWDGMHPLVLAVIAIFVGDFVGYWRHRFEHTPLLWPSHAVHHSDTEMTWLSLVRFHPINRITTYVIDTGVLLLLGLPPFAILINNFVRHYYGFLIHADLPWTYGPLGKVFVSPAMHRWHHAADVAAFNTNYATVFSIFDRAFGTWRVPGPCTAPLGVTDQMEHSLSSQMLYAFKPRAYRRMIRWVRGR